MATYKISVYFIIQFAFGISYEDRFIEINIPFVRLMFSTYKDSVGYNIFNKYFE